MIVTSSPSMNGRLKLTASSRKTKREKEKDKGWACDLLPKGLIVARYFPDEQVRIDQLTSDLEAANVKRNELEEEHDGEDGAFSELEKINKATVAARLKELKSEADASDEAEILSAWQKVYNDEANLKKDIKAAEADLDAKAYAKYPDLSEGEIKTLVVDDKWLSVIDDNIHGELDRISQALTGRVRVLAERYENPMPELVESVANLESKVEQHLKQMGFAW